MQLRTFVITSDRYKWALRPFSYLFNVYWSSLQPVVVVGYSRPDFDLPSNFKFHSIAPTNYPPERWSDALIQFLKSVPDEHFVLMQEDYWLVRTVDHQGIASLHEYMRDHPDVLKIDLTNDRLHKWDNAPEAHDYDYWGHYDIVLSDPATPYRMSMQSAIWNKSQMLRILREGHTPWEVELLLGIPDDMIVLGTRQLPLRYANAILKGDVMSYEIDRIPEPHRANISQWIPKGWKVTVPNVNI